MVAISTLPTRQQFAGTAKFCQERPRPSQNDQAIKILTADWSRKKGPPSTLPQGGNDFTKQPQLRDGVTSARSLVIQVTQI